MSDNDTHREAETWIGGKIINRLVKEGLTEKEVFKDILNISLKEVREPATWKTGQGEGGEDSKQEKWQASRHQHTGL